MGQIYFRDCSKRLGMFLRCGRVEIFYIISMWQTAELLVNLQMCCASLLSHVQLFATPSTVAGQAPLSTGILQARILGWVAMPSSRESSQPRDRTQISCIAGWFFTIWTTEKSKNIEVGSLSLLQGNFPTQESNWSLLHCRRILYQLSYPGNSDKNLQILYHIFWTKSKAFQILKKKKGTDLLIPSSITIAMWDIGCFFFLPSLWFWFCCLFL